MSDHESFQPGHGTPVRLLAPRYRGDPQPMPGVWWCVAPHPDAGFWWIYPYDAEARAFAAANPERAKGAAYPNRQLGEPVRTRSLLGDAL